MWYAGLDAAALLVFLGPYAHLIDMTGYTHDAVGHSLQNWFLKNLGFQIKRYIAIFFACPNSRKYADVSVQKRVNLKWRAPVPLCFASSCYKVATPPA
jgi:hypothetical protein